MAKRDQSDRDQIGFVISPRGREALEALQERWDGISQATVIERALMQAARAERIKLEAPPLKRRRMAVAR